MACVLWYTYVQLYTSDRCPSPLKASWNAEAPLMAPAVATYEPRDPSQTVLYHAVADHLVSNALAALLIWHGLTPPFGSIIREAVPRGRSQLSGLARPVVVRCPSPGAPPVRQTLAARRP